MNIKRMLSLVQQFSNCYRVIFGLNERESYQIANVLGIEVEPESADKTGRVGRTCAAIAEKLGILLPRRSSRRVRGGRGPRENVRSGRPAHETAGDHDRRGRPLNAAFCLGQLIGMDPQTSLLMGVCCSG